MFITSVFLNPGLNITYRMMALDSCPTQLNFPRQFVTNAETLKECRRVYQPPIYFINLICGHIASESWSEIYIHFFSGPDIIKPSTLDLCSHCRLPWDGVLSLLLKPSMRRSLFQWSRSA